MHVEFEPAYSCSMKMLHKFNEQCRIPQKETLFKLQRQAFVKMQAFGASFYSILH